jgi:NodT family efflux transporter outer membrane factor (OMF) lipoprotein
MMLLRHRRAIMLGGVMLFLAACAPVGPNYKRPSAPVPVSFKEPLPAGWKLAEPGGAFVNGKWWEIYNDPVLNALEEQVSISNQNVLQAEAQYNEARAAAREARSALFPTVSAGIGITATGAGGAASNAAGANGSSSAGTRTAYSLPFNVAWEPDLWGSIRRSVTGNIALAQASEADLENARLLFQAELAQDYFQLHGIDGDADLLRTTADSYNEYLTLTKNRYAAGVASDLDVAQAESQLYSTQSALIDLGEQRAQLEHAIAILIGKPPSDLTLPPVALTMPPPQIPIGLPSDLLERRPDIAGAERRVAAANEQIGIAMAAFYPVLSLSASAGLNASSLAKWFTWPSRFWSVGPGLSDTLFDAGRRRAIVAQQQAAYDATVAGYRQSVLTALQQVEDNLAALRVLSDESDKLQQNIQSADRALNISSAQYKAGTTSYLTVITSQAALLGSQRSAVQLLSRRLTASVLLVEALGGGWNTSRLPSRQQVMATGNHPAGAVVQ